ACEYKEKLQALPAGGPSGHDTGAGHRAFGFWIAGATLIVANALLYSNGIRDTRPEPDIRVLSSMRIGRGVELCNIQSIVHNPRNSFVITPPPRLSSNSKCVPPYSRTCNPASAGRRQYF